MSPALEEHAANATGPVLVIDDSLTIRKLLEMALGRAGHPLEMAALGREGLALAKRVRPRLILLDYVLPDVKGTEICDELGLDPFTAGVPVVIMSGKGDDIRPLFKSRRTVVDFVAKPFSPAEILHVIDRALGRSAQAAQAAQAKPPTSSIAAPTPASPATTALQPNPATVARLNQANGSPAPASPLTARHGAPANGSAAPGALTGAAPAPARDTREAAARVLFGALRERLSRLPEWIGEVNGQPPAPFLGRRLLTPEVVGAVLTGLTPLIGPATPAPAAPASPFAGSTAFLPVLTLLRLVADTHRTGVLHLGSGGAGAFNAPGIEDANGVEAWFSRGDLVLAAPTEMAAVRRMLGAAGLAEEPGRTATWRATAQAAGIPTVVVAAAAAGAPGSTALHRLGRQTLVAFAGQGPVDWSWRDLPALPAEVEQAAQAIPIEQLALDRLRLVDDWSQVELDVRSLGQVCERLPDFRARLPLFELTAEEAKVLLHVDGRAQVKDVLEHSGMTTFDVFHILYRLIQVKLIRTRDGEAGALATAGAGPVLLCSPLKPGGVPATDGRHGGDPGTAKALAAWFTRRGDGVRLATADAAHLERIVADQPRLVLVDLDHEAAGQALALARAVRQRLEVSATPLVALAPRADRDLQRDLLIAGFDQVLVKPIHLNAISRLLDG